MSKLRCLSVHQPWAWAICAGLKRIENRTWTTNYRGLVCIHAAAAKERLAKFVRQVGDGRVPPLAQITGAIVGVTELTGVVELNESLESDASAIGPICWIFERGRLLAEPVPCKGKTSLFFASPEDSTKVEEQLASTDKVSTAADKDIKRALSLKPVELQLERAAVYWDMQRYADVIRCCTAAISHDADCPAPFRGRSLALSQLKRNVEAMADIDRAIELDGSYALAFVARADLWRAMGNQRKADADLALATKLDPNVRAEE